MRKVLSIVLIALLAITGLAASGASDSSGDAGKGELYIYTTVSDTHYDLTMAAFNELYPDITVYSTYGGAGECKARIQAEAANPQADLMFGGLQYADLDAYGQYFETYVSKNDELMLEEYRNTSGKLTFHDSQIPCLIVNDALEAELGIKVTGWESLLDPALKGKIVTANPTSSSSAWNNLQCILTDFGGWDSEEAWDYIAKLMQNGLVVVSSSSIPSRSTFSGEYVVGLTYEPSVVKMLDGGQTGAHMVFPEEGTTSVGFASAIIKGAKNLENAKLFMDFLQSDAGQQTYLDAGARPITTHKIEGGSQYMVDLDTILVKAADTQALADNKAAICDRWNEYWAKYGNN